MGCPDRPQRWWRSELGWQGRAELGQSQQPRTLLSEGESISTGIQEGKSCERGKGSSTTGLDEPRAVHQPLSEWSRAQEPQAVAASLTHRARGEGASQTEAPRPHKQQPKALTGPYPLADFLSGIHLPAAEVAQWDLILGSHNCTGSRDKHPIKPKSSPPTPELTCYI